MRFPQLIVYETDGVLAAMLRRLASEQSWLLREPRQPEACLALLDPPRPSALFIRLERDPYDGLNLLRQVHEFAPDCSTVIVSDGKLEGADQRAQLSALAFDLGARFILFPPIQQSVLEDLAAGLLAVQIGHDQGETDNPDSEQRGELPKRPGPHPSHGEPTSG